MSNVVIRFLGLMIGMLVIGGCVTPHPYNVSIRNSGVSEFSHSEVDFGEKRIGAGWVSPGNVKTSIDITHSIPEKATVRWRRGDNTDFERDVVVKKLLPPRDASEYYTLIFSVNEDDNVAFSVVNCKRDYPCPELYGK